MWAAPYLVHSGEVAGKLGIFNVALGTTQETLAREGTPDDTLDRLDLGRMESQLDEVAALLLAVASEEGLSLRHSIKTQKLYITTEFGTDNRPHGPMAMGLVLGSAVPDRPMANATVQLTVRFRERDPNNLPRLPWRPTKPYAFDDFIVLRTNLNGSYSYGPVQPHQPSHAGFAIETDERGVVTSVSGLRTAKTVSTRLNMFTCRDGVAVLPPLLAHRAARVLRAKTNSPLDDAKAHYATWDGVVHWYVERKVDGVKLFGLESMVGFGNGPDSITESGAAAPSEATGFPTEGPRQPPSSALRAATDLWRLNESRIQLMRDRGLMNSSIEELHGHAEDLLLEAEPPTATPSP